MGSWTQMVSMKASAQFEWKYSSKSHHFRSWQQPKVTTCFFWTQRLQEPNVVYSQENGTFICYYMHTSKWFLFTTASIFNNKSLRSFKHVHSCTNMIFYYVVEMYVYVYLILLPNTAQSLNFTRMLIGTYNN